MLIDMDENGRMRELNDIDYRERFDLKWNEFTPQEQLAIDAEINRLLDALRDDPDPKWGSIMNTPAATSISARAVRALPSSRHCWTLGISAPPSQSESSRGDTTGLK